MHDMDVSLVERAGSAADSRHARTICRVDRDPPPFPTIWTNVARP